MDAIETLCVSHAHMPREAAWHVARRLPAWTRADDLEPAAWEGLYLAAASWRPDLAGDRPFARWAWRRITGEILSDVRRRHPLTRGEQARAQAVDAAEARLLVGLGRAPTVAEVAEAAGVTPAQVRALAVARVAAWAPLDVTGAGVPPLTAPPLVDPDTVADADALAWVHAAVAALDERRRHVIVGLYWDGLTHTDLAAEYGVTASRIAQIHTAAVAAIRDAVLHHTRGDPGPPLKSARTRRRDAYRAAVATHHHSRSVAA